VRPARRPAPDNGKERRALHATADPHRVVGGVSVETARVRADFDRLALLGAESGDAGDDADRVLLRHAPREIDSALEIGCGTGSFTRKIAARARRVLAVDLSPEMVRVARERCRGLEHVEFRIADAAALEPGDGAFDCVASIAALHHLPAEETLEKLARALRPGGVLLVSDLRRLERPLETAAAALALPFLVARRLLRTGRLRERRAVREAWARHALADRHLTLLEARGLFTRMLPGARVAPLRPFRYTAVWRAPSRLPIAPA